MPALDIQSSKFGLKKTKNAQTLIVFNMRSEMFKTTSMYLREQNIYIRRNYFRF